MDLTSGGPLRCDFCDQSFNSHHFLYQHCNQWHGEELKKFWIGCNKCSKFYPTAQSATAHAYEHKTHQEWWHQCKFCRQNNFSSKIDFVCHMNSNHKNKIGKTWILCRGCRHFFPNFEMLKSHLPLVVDGGDPRFKCGDLGCNFCTADVRNFSATKYYNHMRQKHHEQIKNVWAECEFCKRCFSTVSIRNRHRRQCPLKKHQLSTAPVPGADVLGQDQNVVSMPPSIILDVSVTTDTTAGYVESNVPKLSTIECRFCGLALPTFAMYINHANKFHKPQIEYSWKKCTVIGCTKSFPSSKSQKRHLKAFHNIQPSSKFLQLNKSNVQKPASSSTASFRCEFCEESFQRKSQLCTHINNHHKDDVREHWTCCSNSCGLFFPTEHLAALHSSSLKCSKASLSTTAAATDSEKKVACQFCPMTFRGKSARDGHARLEHPQQVAAYWFKCHTCDFYFPSSEALTGHAKLHVPRDENGPDVRENRVQSKASNGNLARSKFERVGDHFQCNECSLLLLTWSEFESHVSFRHTKVKTNKKLEAIAAETKQCPLCSAEVKNIGRFYSHVKRFHSAIVSGFWITCEECNEYFPSESVLRKHHNKICNINCKFCHLKFRSKRAYYEHANVQHSNVVSREWHQCDGCKRCYPTRTSLEKHRYTAHREHSNDAALQSPLRRATTDPSTSSPVEASSSSSRNVPIRDENNLYVADNSISNEGGQKNGQLEATSPSKGSLCCPFCSLKLSSTKASLYRHVNVKHSNEAATFWLPCDFCHMRYPTKTVLYNHVYMTHKRNSKVESESTTKVVRKKVQNLVIDSVFSLSEIENADDNLLQEVAETASPEENVMHDNDMVVPIDEVFPDSMPSQHSSVQETIMSFPTSQFQQPSISPCRTEASASPPQAVTGVREPSMSQSRPSRSPITCSICLAKFDDPQVFFHHSNLNHREMISKSWHHCTSCLWFFPSKKSLSNHGCENRPNLVKCQFCPVASFDSAKCHDYVVHANKFHFELLGKSGWICCLICLKFLPDGEALKQHSIDCQTDQSDVTIKDEADATSIEMDGSNVETDAISIESEAEVIEVSVGEMQILAPVEVKDVDDDDDGEEASSSEKTLCPLCQAQIGTDESDITQHLFDAHGI